jgi:uncharacterized membrane protein YvlD (DUF360 family)
MNGSAEPARRRDVRPPVRPARLIFSWLVGAVAVFLAAALLPGLDLGSPAEAVLVALALAAINAVLPPLVAALRLPYTVATTLLLVLLVNVLAFRLIDGWTDNALEVGGFGAALVAALVVAAIAMALQEVLGANDDDLYSLRVTQRLARRTTQRVQTDVPGIVFLEIDGLAKPILQRAMRDGNAPELAQWVADGTHRLVEWETDLSSQTGASQAGILLGSNEDIPAFRWVEKERGTMMVCSNPDDCAEIEARHSTGDGLLAQDGASRGNLLSGDADHVLMTVSRVSAEKRANPGYRPFFANGNNVTRVLVLFIWEVVLELVAARRQAGRNVQPRGHRGLRYAFLRGGVCVFVRDVTAYTVIFDMLCGRPAVYATFASYDEVAHHSGLERPDTLEALRKLDRQFGRIARASKYASRPYRIVVLSDHGQTQGATFKQRNGYALEDLVGRSLARGEVHAVAGEDEDRVLMANAVEDATSISSDAVKPAARKNDVGDKDVVVLGSGNLGLIYLMQERRRLSLEEIEERHPGLLPALRSHPHIGLVMGRSDTRGAIVLGARGARYLKTGEVAGEDPLAPFPANAARHLLRSDGFEHAPDLYVNSFYDPQLDEGCAFEELISFHGGLGGPQTSAFLLAPVELPLPADPIVGAAAVHDVLKGWRTALQPPAEVGAEPVR